MKLAATTLTTTTPCCARGVRVSAIHSVPVQAYERTCSKCKQAWTIVRRTKVERADGVRVDVLEWEHDAAATVRRTLQHIPNRSTP